MFAANNIDADHWKYSSVWLKLDESGLCANGHCLNSEQEDSPHSQIGFQISK